jgi:hypothetical protein
MAGRTVAQVLDIWRDIERLLETLPPDDPQVPALREEIAQLRVVYRRLTSTSRDVASVLRSCQMTIEHAHALLRSTNARDAARAVRPVRRLVVRHGSRHWEVVEERTGLVVASAGLREEAALAARRMLRLTGGEIVLIHGDTGEAWKTLRVDPSRSGDEPPRKSA